MRNRADDTIHFTVGESSFGLILVAQSDVGVCAVLMGDDRQMLRDELHGRFPAATFIEDGGDSVAFASEVIACIESPRRTLDVPLDLRGTEFQRIVWNALRRIPVGSTASYTEVAHAIGRPAAVRAVAHACASNALAVIVPCHRVVRHDGGLSAYRWGVERKRILLAKERTIFAQMVGDHQETFV